MYKSQEWQVVTKNASCRSIEYLPSILVQNQKIGRGTTRMVGFRQIFRPRYYADQQKKPSASAEVLRGSRENLL